MLRLTFTLSIVAFDNQIMKDGKGVLPFSNRIAVKVFVLEIHVQEIVVVGLQLQREKGNNRQHI